MVLRLLGVLCLLFTCQNSIGFDRDFITTGLTIVMDCSILASVGTAVTRSPWCCELIMPYCSLMSVWNYMLDASPVRRASIALRVLHDCYVLDGRDFNLGMGSTSV